VAANQSGGEGDLDLLPSEWGVLVAIDGSKDLRALAAALGSSEFETAKTVFGLESAGVLVLREGARPAGPLQAADLGDVLAKARAKLDAGEPDAARSLIDPALGTHPGEPRLHLLLGRTHLLTGRAVEAEEALRRALRLDPTLAPAHRLLGNALVLRGKLGEAVEWWERWLAFPAVTDRGERELVTRAISAARDLDAATKGTDV